MHWRGMVALFLASFGPAGCWGSEFVSGPGDPVGITIESGPVGVPEAGAPDVASPDEPDASSWEVSIPDTWTSPPVSDAARSDALVCVPNGNGFPACLDGWGCVCVSGWCYCVAPEGGQ
jgi:hypothetical protein